MTLIYVDLDDFAKFKQEHGEVEANSLLMKLGQCFQNLFRKEDLLARIHEDEFLILLPGVSPENALDSLHRFRATLEDTLKNFPGRSQPVLGP